ncbi:zinc/manganese transport system ATP-binding protein [Nonomuraea solani]|uniref:Zinc/manganese transport system ATP-binding protein n=1 Tax=Nonomuraea solani TaxID=1144553 RepID=A0A1H6EW23_9ACTN|nr:zinc ABC transporter ATP-binding protein AztA [Nonomuraea solani]SEH02038.1 zinc/manganese transport system ATP-binding protein [Nonomuraea solani]
MHGTDGVVISDVTAGYGSRTVLYGITARLPRSGVTAVVGPNGSGKSTLLGVLAGVVRPSRGTIDHANPGRPAFVVQRDAVSDSLPMTVRDTVAMGRWVLRGPWRRLTALDHSVIDACLAALDVSDLAGRQLSTLSGGQRQRVLVAQGLAQESGLLLLDEPTTGLDMSAREHISGALDRERARGVTVVHTTHDLELALRADHCLLLEDGRLLAEGPPGSVLTSQALGQVFHGLSSVPNL